MYHFPPPKIDLIFICFVLANSGNKYILHKNKLKCWKYVIYTKSFSQVVTKTIVVNKEGAIGTPLNYAFHT